LALGLGLQPPWELTSQRLDPSVSPHELHLTVSAARGTRFPCPECGESCPAHDYKELVWRHLNFFRHHGYLHARVPRVKFPAHGVKRINVPWARPGSDFTLLFEQAAMLLVREMPVLAAARFMEITDTRQWRIVHHSVGRSIERLDLSELTQIALDETASRRGHRYVTVFLDMARTEGPVIFVIPGRGKDALTAFSQFLQARDGRSEQIAKVVCGMPPAFLSGIDKESPQAEGTVD
jgi:transposase